MQFDAVEEIGRQLNLPGDAAVPVKRTSICRPCRLEPCICGSAFGQRCAALSSEPESPAVERDVDCGLDAQVPPLPLSEKRRHLCRMDGTPEDLDLGLLKPPSWASEHDPCRQLKQQQGPRRQKHFVPIVQDEPDPHEVGADGAVRSYIDSRRVPMTGSVAASMPQYRRKPPYRTRPDGTAEIRMADDPLEESSLWKHAFARDARKNFVRSHIHMCKNTSRSCSELTTA